MIPLIWGISSPVMQESRPSSEKYVHERQLFWLLGYSWKLVLMIFCSLSPSQVIWLIGELWCMTLNSNWWEEFLWSTYNHLWSLFIQVIGYWLFSKSKKKSSLFFGLLGERRKKGVSIVLFIGGSLSVQVIWLIGYSVKIKRKKFSHFFGLPGETIHKYLVKGLDDM